MLLSLLWPHLGFGGTGNGERSTASDQSNQWESEAVDNAYCDRGVGRAASRVSHISGRHVEATWLVLHLCSICIIYAHHALLQPTNTTLWSPLSHDPSAVGRSQLCQDECGSPQSHKSHPVVPIAVIEVHVKLLHAACPRKQYLPSAYLESGISRRSVFIFMSMHPACNSRDNLGIIAFCGIILCNRGFKFAPYIARQPLAVSHRSGR